MCVLARVFEEASLTTAAIALLMPPVEHVKPPRTLVVPFPYGYALGKPDDPVYQHKVLKAVLDLLERNNTPVVAEFPEKLDRPVEILQASKVQASVTPPDPSQAANDVTALRVFHERWVADHGGRTAVGLSKVPQRSFRGAVRFLEAYARGEEADHPQRPTEMPRPQFIRYVVEDLKAFAYEARMAQRPSDDESALHTWFWGETGLGMLIKSVADQVTSTGDDRLRLIAGGIAR